MPGAGGLDGGIALRPRLRRSACLHLNRNSLPARDFRELFQASIHPLRGASTGLASGQIRSVMRLPEWTRRCSGNNMEDRAKQRRRTIATMPITPVTGHKNGNATATDCSAGNGDRCSGIRRSPKPLVAAVRAQYGATVCASAHPTLHGLYDRKPVALLRVEIRNHPRCDIGRNQVGLCPEIQTRRLRHVTIVRRHVGSTTAIVAPT